MVGNSQPRAWQDQNRIISMKGIFGFLVWILCNHPAQQKRMPFREEKEKSLWKTESSNAKIGSTIMTKDEVAQLSLLPEVSEKYW